MNGIGIEVQMMKREMHREAAEHLQETISNQIDGIRRIDSKTAQLVSANLIVAGAFITGIVSQIQSQEIPVSFIIYAAAGIFTLFISLGYAIRVYGPHHIEYGIGSTVSEDIEDIDNLDQFYSDLLNAYVTVFNINKDTQETKASSLHGESLWFITEILFFFAAFLRMFIRPKRYTIFDLVIVSILIIISVFIDRYLKNLDWNQTEDIDDTEIHHWRQTKLDDWRQTRLSDWIRR